MNLWFSFNRGTQEYTVCMLKSKGKSKTNRVTSDSRESTGLYVYINVSRNYCFNLTSGT